MLHSMESFCCPAHGGVWDSNLKSGFGALTPCFIETVMIGLSQCTVCCLVFYRVWLILKGRDVRRFQLKQKSVHYFMIPFAAVLAIWPIVQILLGISAVNLDGQSSLAPFEVISLLFGSFTWLSLLFMLVNETRIYIRKFRWYVRFGIIYLLVAEATLYRFIVSLKSFYDRSIFTVCMSHFACQVVFGVLFVFHLPNLVPHPSYHLLDNDVEMSADYEPLPTKEQVCPERHGSLLSRLFFTWMTPLMKQGFKRPIAEADIWKLDEWDQTGELHKIFQKVWDAECTKDKPSLLRALNKSIGGRFWLGGIFKIGTDASQFVGPLMLNLLLQSMQSNDPTYVGYLYSASIFLGLMAGVIFEGQFLQNVLRTGFRTRATLVAAIFHKTLRITQEGRKGFNSGRILNLMTTDAECLQQICMQLHNLWSAPIRVVVCVYLLHKQLGKSALAGTMVLLLLFPLQAFMINRMRRFTREGLQRTDIRIGLMSEILSAMDIVKCYAWEESFRAKVLDVRNNELCWFRNAMIFGSINSFLLNSIPVLVTVIAFGMYTLTGGDLTPAKAFTSLSLFAVLRFPLFMLPSLITQIANVKVSLQRLQAFLLAEERVLELNPPPTEFHPAIHIQNGNFVWDKKITQSTLRNISMDIPAGSLVAIVGGTGEGKSSLVSAILGEMSSLDCNKVCVRGKVAYVSQVSWIFNGTVRNNILFGSAYDAVRYKTAIHVSCLNHDLELLPGGDLTEIGERGVNISGGQKQRISIARAVYADADVYIFDDPLSALDAQVARKVFESCILKELSCKTRLLVTNQLHFLARVDTILLLHGGEIKEQGTYEDLLARGVLFKQLMDKYGKMEETSEMYSNMGTSEISQSSIVKSIDASEGRNRASHSMFFHSKRDGKSRLVRSEERETGVLSWSVLDRYQEALGGVWVVFILFFCYVMVEAARASSSTWLSVWTSSESRTSNEAFFYTTIYAIFSFIQIFTILFNSLWIILRSLSAAQFLHNKMLSAILRAPMSFFHSNPLGRIINRFAKDTADIDRNVASSANTFLGSIFQLGSTFVMIGIVNTASLWAIMPLLIVLYTIFMYYQSTAREVKRLDSITRSPVYAQFGEAINGLITIRAYKAHDRMAKANANIMDNNLRFTLVNISSNRWLGIRLECLGGLMIWTIATFAVLANQHADQFSFSAQMGLLLTYSLNITTLMTSTLRQASMGENSFNAVERVGRYIDLVSEAPLVIEKNRPPSGWPSKGAVEFRNIVMRYRGGLPPVLAGLSAKIQPNEKIGIVGRTGAGKSSMFNSLFRLVEPESGHILIDSVDVCKIGLNDLRKSLSIIPQTPVLFSGTVRFNLDPFEEQSDIDLWEALGRAHLKDVIKRKTSGLDTEVAENGENFSVGQRQLLSLARALVRRSSVLVLDEATASVDVGTDALIQKTIREEFKSCTMLIIAHRLNTIIDCDRIMVLDAGQIKEMDTPRNLLADKSSLFSKMVESTGYSNAEYLRGVAMGEINLDPQSNKQEKKIRSVGAPEKMEVAPEQVLATPVLSPLTDLEVFAARGVVNGILQRTNDAVKTLHAVLQGQHDNEVDFELSQQQMAAEGWWTALLNALQGLLHSPAKTESCLVSVQMFKENN